MRNTPMDRFMSLAVCYQHESTCFASLETEDFDKREAVKVHVDLLAPALHSQDVGFFTTCCFRDQSFISLSFRWKKELHETAGLHLYNTINHITIMQ